MPRTDGEELIVLLNEKGEATGTAPKLASHHYDTPLHLAFSCYLFDEDGHFLLTQRALSKKTWPGIWSNSCCGHPLPKEPLPVAVNRRLHHELGITGIDIDLIIPSFRYRAVAPDGIVENEMGPVVRVWSKAPIIPNPSEVGGVRWVPWSAVVEDVISNKGYFSPWSRLTITELSSLGDHPLFWPLGDPALLPPAIRQT